MRAISFVREGLRIAGRHKRLILVLWLAPLIPALVVGAMAAANLSPDFGKSLFADRALDGGWFVVLMEFRSSPADALKPIVTRGLIVMAFLTLLVQVSISAGVVETLLERPPGHPFFLGIRRNFLRFLRTTCVLAVLTVAIVFGCRLMVKGFFKIAAAQSDGRFDIFGIIATVTLFFIVWAPLDLAADLSRFSAARHDDRSMVRGFFRSWVTVIRRPGLFIPLYLVFLLLPLALHAVYIALRSPWTPGTAAAIAALFVAQQTVMLIRAFFKLGFWGAEVTAFRDLEEPRWCRARTGRKHAELIEASEETAPRGRLR
jgi:hypothetical protein